MNKSGKVVCTKLWLLIVVAALLSACSSSPTFKRMYHYTYTPPASSQGLACVRQCEQTMQGCERVCSPGAGACKTKAREEARLAYQEYTVEREAVGLPIKRSVDSFYDASACPVDKTCDCEQEYRACYRLCGGTVSSSLKR